MEANAVQYEFNDYKRLTRGYLRDYRMWQSAIEVWASEKADIDSELASIPIATSKFGGEAGGGSGELTPTEREANRRVKFTERALSIARDTRELRRVMKNIETAIGTLDDESKRLIVMHYIDGRTWMEVADALACSESGARQKGYRAVSKIAAILFGSKINQYTQVVLIA